MQALQSRLVPWEDAEEDPKTNMEAHKGRYIEDVSLMRGQSPLPC